MEIESIISWLQTGGLKILLIIVGAWIFNRFGSGIIRRIVRQVIKPDAYASRREEKLREDTLISIISAVMRVAVWLIAIMIVLTELSIDIGPLIAGAGVVGFAVGFGAQTLIKDFIAGIFIILENQYRVGDVVELNGVGGKVIAITMRTTVLRDLNGSIHHIPNGTVKLATNKTMEYARINIDIGVSYASDLDKVEQVINQVGKKMAQDKELKNDIVEPPKFARVKEFSDAAVVVKVLGKVMPSKQWRIAGEFRRQIKSAFDKAGIEIPYPQIVVHQAKNR